MSSDQPVLDVANLSAGYGRYAVLRDLDLHVRAGEVCAVLGPNGAGKSTLLRAVLGLVPQVSGRISIDGVDVVGDSTFAIARRGLGYVAEGRGILNSLTVRENLQLAVGKSRRAVSKRRGGRGDEAVEQAVRRFPDLSARLDEPAGRLSGGQQQMLAIARALVGRPRLILIDEPSLGLAPKIRKDLARLLSGIATDDDVAVLLAEQDVSLAAACATRAHVLRLGVIQENLSGKDLEPSRLRHFYLGASTPPDRRTTGT